MDLQTAVIVIVVIGVLILLLPMYSPILPIHRKPCSECGHKGYWHSMFMLECTMNHCTCEQYHANS